MIKKRLLSLILTSLVLITSFFGISSNVNATNNEEFVFETIDIKDLDEHPDVKEKIIEEGFEDYIKEEKSYKELSELYEFVNGTVKILNNGT
ncbi:hypothetical protein M4D70_25925 [Brevibacillus borstelensis]|uniref:hypothetical protein n=1 Tax=Brevibacillus borstelensis TaxID=45462 RepID=UPI00203CE82F|nr:hypothetical protein [Brevibacillus borstelensis]MCM3625613.1 hypothetical protein [Brevibacillus borstelensis]